MDYYMSYTRGVYIYIYGIYMGYILGYKNHLLTGSTKTE